MAGKRASSLAHAAIARPGILPTHFRQHCQCWISNPQPHVSDLPASCVSALRRLQGFGLMAISAAWYPAGSACLPGPMLALCVTSRDVTWPSPYPGVWSNLIGGTGARHLGKHALVVAIRMTIHASFSLQLPAPQVLPSSSAPTARRAGRPDVFSMYLLRSRS